MAKFIPGIQPAQSFLKVRGQDFSQRGIGSTAAGEPDDFRRPWRSSRSTKSPSLVMTTSAAFFCGQKNLIVLATFRVGDVLANGFGAVKVFNMASLTLTDVPEDLRAQLENEALATGPESPVTEKEMDAIRDRVLKRKAA